jgi:hypothetical protein
MNLIDPGDTVISCHTKSNSEFLNELKAAGIRVINAGDSVRPRNLHSAVTEGAAFGLSLDENLLFNSNDAIMNDLPIDVLRQLV